jgi:gliding motility-associated lipoprotein GldD|tara:strand:- start:980 stop:1540 length:561 start_codon:yes stop_codon:yes gene_type:complete
MKPYAVLLCILVCLSCDEVLVPKPKAFLSLDYPQASYHESLLDLPFIFETNKLARLSVSKKNNSLEGLILRYPNLKASIFINYKTVNNNLKTHISDARKMTQKHRQMADEISERKYDNNSEKVSGMFYDLKGNVASQSQFYVTDSTRHFLSGALYFETKPNYDSILPAINYIQKDMMHLIESLRWK